MYFEALASGGGSDWFYTVILKAPLGASIVVDDGDEEVEATGTGNYIGIPVHNANSTYTITVETNGLTAPTQTVTTGSDSGGMSTPIDFNYAAINVTYDEEFRGQNATVTDGTHTASVAIPAAPSTSVTIYVPYTGNWAISAVDPVSGNTFYTNPNPVVVSSLTQTINAILYVIPDGKTVTPTDDISLWLMCANIKDKNYTTLDEVLADEDCLFRLLTSDNANDYLKRSTTWINAGLVPTMIDSTHPSGQVTASAEYTSSYPAWKAFNESEDYGWGVFSTKAFSANDWVQYEFPTAQVARKVRYSYKFSTGDCAFTFKIQGSNDGFVSDVNDLCAEQSNVAFVSNTRVYKDIELNNSVAYKYYRLFITSDASSNGGYGIKLQFHPFKEGITENELAMQIIGADDYATETLLDDSDWAEAIAESEYFEEVDNYLNPTMTSNTTPEGVCSGSSNGTTSSTFWGAFTKNETGFNEEWFPDANETDSYVDYEFAHPLYVNKIAVNFDTYNYSSDTAKIDIQGSKDGGTTYSKIGEFNLSGISRTTTRVYLKPEEVVDSDLYTNIRIKFTGIVARYSGSSFISITGTWIYGHQIGAVQTWLKAAGIQKPYITLDEVLADRDTLATLMANETAVDYLVTAKSFIEDICANETAMKYIGKNNYAADTLLSDAEWLNAIINSTYMKSVLNAEVPTMTSNTTPSGEAYASSEYVDQSTTYKAFFAYRGMGGSAWYPSGNPNGAWVAYDFGKNIPVYKVKFMPNVNPGYQFSTVKIQASIDKAFTNPIDVTGNISVTPSSNSEVLTTVVGEYRYYRILIVSATTTSGVTGILNANFYGREDVVNDTIDIYSAADDQVFYYDQNNNPVTIATTDSTGHATILRSNLPNGEYELFSTVAKNPYDLASVYHKKVKVTDDTIDIYVMPEGEILYWYGYEGKNLEDCTSANGWGTSGYTYNAPTHNTNSIRLSSTSGTSNLKGVGSKIKLPGITKAIVSGVTVGGGTYANIETVNTKSFDDYKDFKCSTTFGSEYVFINENDSTYSMICSMNGRVSDVQALWVDNRMPTFLSAANDTLYILDGATQVPIAYTDKYGESYDAMLPPGTYDIYSSIAKDPNNLFNPYHKQVTITEYTRTVKVMPDKTFYWYGFTNEDLTGGWARGYNASSASVTNWTDYDYLYGSTVNTQTISISSKKRVPIEAGDSYYSAVYEQTQSPGAGQGGSYIYLSTSGPGETSGWAMAPNIFQDVVCAKKKGTVAIPSNLVGETRYIQNGPSCNTGTSTIKVYALYFE